MNPPLKVARTGWTRRLAFGTPLGNSARALMTSRLKNAEERLEKAVARIDDALAQSAGTHNSDTRLADLENENSSLRQQNEEIAGRLDVAIARLQRILQAS